MVAPFIVDIYVQLVDDIIKMNQQASRKAIRAQDSKEPTASRQTKTSVDFHEKPEKPRNRSKSKNKIPKSVRYDLDNALVSLCDVWFEEIKPYLVRNNIKLHVHGAEGEAEADAAGDRACSHLDPGAPRDHRQHQTANCAGYYSTQPIASKAPCLKPQALQAPLQEPRTTPKTLIIDKSNSEVSVPKTHKRRRPRRTSKTYLLLPQNLVPRLCRTYSILPKTNLQNGVQKYQVERFDMKTKKMDIPEKTKIPGVKSKTKNKNVQTEKSTDIEFNTKELVIPCPKSYGRRTSCFLGQSKKNNELRSIHELSPLFKNDLIDIIAEKHEKRLLLLYKSPASKRYSSIMNLLPSPTTRRKSPPPKPWR